MDTVEVGHTATGMSSAPDGLSSVAPGSIVLVRDEEWLVTGAEETADGLLIRVHGLTPLVRDTTATFYQSLDKIEPLDPAQAEVVADDSPRYARSRLWLEATIRKSAVPLGDPSLTVAMGALADPLEYQHAAVRKALDPANLRPRILLADAVGLGKTLEIGMILSELVRRGRAERILVVTPRHVLEQMQQELWNRFALPFVRLDSAGIQRVRQRIPATRNPFTYYKRVIISIDTLKSDRYVAGLQRQRWDAVVIDEAHNLTNVSTLNNRLARLLSRSSEALILASATPHNGRAESFAELVRLLDPAAVRPSGELVLDDVARLVVRRHRHSPEVARVVGASWAERLEPQNLPVTASAAEDSIARELEDVWLFPGSGASPYSGKTTVLFGWTLAKAFLSSTAALDETVTQRLRRLETGGGSQAVDREREALVRLRDLARIASTTPAAKYERLLELLRERGIGAASPKRVVIFAERIATLRWLCERLPGDLALGADAVELMHGGLPDVEQQRVVDDFKQVHAPVRVLVTGDVASEGVNLHQQCHDLIHYDIPWSLIRLEQRNGRIDRYGQKHHPRITTLLLDPSSERFAGDLRVLTKLVEREHEAHRALGDSASLMGRHTVEAEEDAIRKVLAGVEDFDAVVKTPDEVASGGGIDALFAQLATAPGPAVDSSSHATTDAAGPIGGLYPDEVSFLQEAVQQTFLDPAAPPERHGVGWRRDAAFGTVSIVPTPDLVQRLEVLPQRYLAERRVTSELVLATTVARAKNRLAAALLDDSDSSWPDAHHLAPLHPVLDWVADRALAELGRNRVPAVRGDVDGPTVLLYGTLTNRRGHVVAAAWSTATFRDHEDPKPHALVTPYGSPLEALDAIGWLRVRSNPGPVAGAELLQRLVRPAVEAARGQMGFVMAEAEGQVTRQVRAWAARLRGWDDEADALVQRGSLRDLRREVHAEQELVDAMRPDRRLVRALLVVVPDDTDQQPAGSTTEGTP